MALNFPNSPGIGSVFTDTTSGFSYQWDGTLWKSYAPASSSNIQILDDISGSFNGSTTTFALTSNAISFTPANSQQLRVVLGGVVQAPGTDYYVSASNIVFTTAPSTGLSFSGVSQGPAVPINTIVDGTITAGSLGVVGLLTAARLQVTGISTFGGISTFQSSIFGTSLSLTGVATASSFVGNLTGNVTGNATGLSGAPNITVTNATVNGTLSVGGTSVILNAATLQINDKDIVVGYTTDGSNNDVSNDTTANHGGIAVASTIGNPLINIPLQVGVNSNPTTYKQFMWIKQGNYSGMGTDAWVSNYPISIGNTSSVKNQSLFTVGAGFTVFSSYLDATDILARNINASGISTLGITSTTDLRLSSIADNTTIVVGSAITLSYNTGGGNVAICSSPTGPITLNVIGIPTDSSFDNRAISFAVIVQQGATAYACTNVTLNGVAFSAAASAGLQTGISYASGTIATGSTTSFDVFNFTGINTVGSAATTLNYKILSNVSGNYRRY